jgi:hypothetical protein
MKQVFMALGLMLVLCGSLGAADRQISITLTVDPADAAIKVVSGSDLKEKTYRSPAEVTATVPGDLETARKNVIEISRDRYKPVTIPLRNLRANEVLRIKLEKQKQLKFQMVAPRQSDTLTIKDGQVQLGLRIDHKEIQMSLMNTTAFPIRLLWQRASYTDPAGVQHRVMHPGIRYEERNRSFPYQTVMPFMTVHQPVMPVDLVVHDAEKKTMENLPLFPPEAAEKFKGKTFDLLLPVEIENKGVVPYLFKIKVLGMVHD